MGYVDGQTYEEAASKWNKRRGVNLLTTEELNIGEKYPMISTEQAYGIWMQLAKRDTFTDREKALYAVATDILIAAGVIVRVAETES